MLLAFARISLLMHPAIKGACVPSIYGVIYQIPNIIPFTLLLRMRDWAYRVASADSHRADDQLCPALDTAQHLKV